MTSCSEYAGRMLPTGRKLKIATTTSGSNPVTARCTGSQIHHQDIHTSRPRLARIGYVAPAIGSAANNRNAAGPPITCTIRHSRCELIAVDRPGC
jgi:hypothetical protein